jgi:hypothetical protein
MIVRIILFCVHGTCNTPMHESLSSRPWLSCILAFHHMGSNETAFFGTDGRLGDKLEKHSELDHQSQQSNFLSLATQWYKHAFSGTEEIRRSRAICRRPEIR